MINLVEQTRERFHEAAYGKITEYDLIRIYEGNTYDLKNKLAKGWELYGSPFSHGLEINPGNLYFFQVMIKREKT